MSNLNEQLSVLDQNILFIKHFLDFIYHPYFNLNQLNDSTEETFYNGIEIIEYILANIQFINSRNQVPFRSITPAQEYLPARASSLSFANLVVVDNLVKCSNCCNIITNVNPNIGGASSQEGILPYQMIGDNNEPDVIINNHSSSSILIHPKRLMIESNISKKEPTTRTLGVQVSSDLHEDKSFDERSNLEEEDIEEANEVSEGKKKHLYRPDCIRKRIKTKFFKYLLTKINKVLIKEKMNCLKKLPKLFVCDPKIKTNKTMVNSSIREIFSKDYGYKKDQEKVAHNKKVIEECKSDVFMSFINSTFKEAFLEYLSSEIFRRDLEIFASRISEKYSESYKFHAVNFIKYFDLSQPNGRSIIEFFK